MFKRGELWFLVQLLLFALIFFLPRVELFPFPFWLRILGLAIIAVGGVFGTGGVLALGRNFSPYPKPIEGGALVTTGVYGIVRHPIYTGLILGTLGWGIFRENLLGAALAVVLFVFFDLKSRREERWLVEAYAGYADYRRRVKKLAPWVY
ncbi:MAG: isoprenylcysteine carboxylmethyltransferase family protein [Chloroflexi bacterium]|nr:isoprenylcysteine carboxylmethyltransferase family protein [Chloroflexota bacterium]